MKLAAPHCQSQKTNSSGESLSEQPGTSAFSQREDKHSELGLLRAVLAQSCARSELRSSISVSVRDKLCIQSPHSTGLEDAGEIHPGPLEARGS